jgi:FkbM family methyltransferase
MRNPFRSWTLPFLATHARVMDLPSAWRYRDYIIRAGAGETRPRLLPLKMRPPVDRLIYIRETGSDRFTFKEIFIDRVYQPVLDYVPQCASMIDLGANIGLASLFLSTHYRCPVFAVEPNPPTYEVLSRNLSRTDIERTVCAGVWSKAATLSGTRSDDHFSMFSVTESEGGGVSGLPMPEIIARSGFKTVGLLKIDIEGAEREVFRGDLSWLEAVQAMAIEFHDTSRSDTSFDAIIDRYGFRVVSEDAHTVVAVKRSNA